jgi:hypothetical protein
MVEIRASLIAFLLWAACTYGLAESISTPASTASTAIANALTLYQKEHDGSFPKSLKELNGRYLNLDQVEQMLPGLADERFLVLGDSTVEMVSPNPNELFTTGRMVAVIKMPVSEDRRRGIGRYVVWQDDANRLRVSWLDEAIVATQFRKAGIPLPTGPPSIQPTTRDTTFEPLIREYAMKNFKDPKNPTADEVSRLKQYFVERHKEKDGAPDLPSGPGAVPESATPIPSLPSEPIPINSTEQQKRSFPWVVVFVAIAMTVFIVWKLRK